MKLLSYFYFCLLVFTVSVTAFTQTRSPVLGERSPNEVPGFEFFRDPRLVSIKVGISKREDIQKAFGSDCSRPCTFDDSWRLFVAYFDIAVNFPTNKLTPQGMKRFRLPEDIRGTVRSIQFLPKQTVSLKDTHFSPPVFGRYVGSQNYFPDGTPKLTVGTIFYQDKYGLAYEIFDKVEENARNVPIRLVPGDLIAIFYKVPDIVERELYTVEMSDTPGKPNK